MTRTFFPLLDTVSARVALWPLRMNMLIFKIHERAKWSPMCLLHSLMVLTQSMNNSPTISLALATTFEIYIQIFGAQLLDTFFISFFFY